MIIELDRQFQDGDLLALHTARVACDFADCTRVLVLTWYTHPGTEVLPEDVSRHVGEEGWFTSGGKHVCSPHP